MLVFFRTGLGNLTEHPEGSFMLGQVSELPSFSRLNGTSFVCTIHLLAGAVFLPLSLAVVNQAAESMDGWMDTS